MNWKEIDSDSRAYKIFDSWFIEHPDFTDRDLYDFFDEQKICINITRDGYDKWDVIIEWEDKNKMIIHTDYDPDEYYKSRKEAEEAAFLKAFEILEEND